MAAKALGATAIPLLSSSKCRDLASRLATSDENFKMVERWHWTCAGSRARSCPLGAELSVEMGGEPLTPALRSVLGWSAVCASFRSAAEMLRRMTAVPTCVKRIERAT